MKNISTVFIDLDDTVWWFTANSKLSLRHVFDHFGFADFCPDYEVFKAIYLAKNKELWDLYHYGKITKDFLTTERFRYTLEHSGYSGDCLKMGAIVDKEYLHFLSLQSTLVPGARQLLEYLNAKGYKVNILSNGFKQVQAQKLTSAGVIHLFKHIILSDDCGITKPLPGIFEYALKVCGASAATSVMIGDNYEADICGAHNAGWRTIFFNKDNAPAANCPNAHFIVSSLSEIQGIL
ncbi:MAG: YjjG family noncanonical pyrimidine nucleotidase [Muribaculaceae bacterium]